MRTPLPKRVYLRLVEGSPAALATVGADGYANAVMTWAVAVAPDTVRFCVDLDTNTYANVQRAGRASLHISAEPNVLVLIKGPVRQIRDRVRAAPFGMAMWEMTVAEVKDQTWEGVIVAPMVYHWVGPQAEAMRRVEQAVLEELRGFDAAR